MESSSHFDSPWPKEQTYHFLVVFLIKSLKELRMIYHWSAKFYETVATIVKK